MARLILINGAPGSGKSSLAVTLAEEADMMLSLDVDGMKHALGRWQNDPTRSGLHARRLSLALADEHLRAGYDIVLGQYLQRTDFIEDLEHVAGRCGATFTEVVLDLDAATLGERLAARAARPSRAEHVVNNRLVGPDDAERLVQSLHWLRGARPNAIWLDARGSLHATLAGLLAVLDRRGELPSFCD